MALRAILAVGFCAALVAGQSSDVSDVIKMDFSSIASASSVSEKVTFTRGSGKVLDPVTVGFRPTGGAGCGAGPYLDSTASDYYCNKTTVKAPEGGFLGGSAPGFTTIIPLFGTDTAQKLYMFTQNSDGDVWQTKLKYDAKGKYTPDTSSKVNIGSTISGASGSGSLSPWCSHLGAETGSGDNNMHGFPFEIYPRFNDIAEGKKHYSMGKGMYSSIVCQGDHKTCFMTGSDGALYMFLADHTRDLASGRLFAAKLNQTDKTDGGSFDISWKAMGGKATNEEVFAALSGSTALWNGNMPVSGQEKFAARSNPQAYATYVNATKKLPAGSTLAIDYNGDLGYMAVPSVVAATTGDTKCGCIYKMSKGTVSETVKDKKVTLTTYGFTKMKSMVCSSCGDDEFSGPTSITVGPYNALFVGASNGVWAVDVILKNQQHVMSGDDYNVGQFAASPLGDSFSFLPVAKGNVIGNYGPFVFKGYVNGFASNRGCPRYDEEGNPRDSLTGYLSPGSAHSVRASILGLVLAVATALYLA